jgi:hypothetical protein
VGGEEVRVLAYICAILGMTLAAGGIAVHHLLWGVHIVPHLAVIMIGAGAVSVLAGFLLFGALVRNERRTIEEAVNSYQRSQTPARQWIID